MGKTIKGQVQFEVAGEWVVGDCAIVPAVRERRRGDRRKGARRKADCGLAQTMLDRR